jgi:hypothetical protein
MLLEEFSIETPADSKNLDVRSLLVLAGLLNQFLQILL